jgi:hypothetical protein
MESLRSLNFELNGENGDSGPVRAAVEEFLPRRLVFAMAEILRMLRALERVIDPADSGLVSPSAYWVVETAWLAILSGDIQDLGKHLENQALGEFSE